MTKIRISLLPAELKKQSSIVKIWTLLALLLTVIALVLLVGNVLLTFYVKVPVDELESMKNENKNLTQSIGRIEYIQEMFDTIELNNNLIKDIKGLDADWSYSINESLADITLYGINVEKLQIGIVEEIPVCGITAWTDSLSNISNWSDQARERDSISYVIIDNISTVSDSENKLTFYFYAEVGLKSWNEGEGE